MKYFEKCVYIIVFIGQSTEAKLEKKCQFYSDHRIFRQIVCGETAATLHTPAVAAVS